MEQLMLVYSWVLAHGLEVVGALSLVINGLIALSLLVPGEQPEKFLQSVLDFLSKFSKK